MNINFSEPRDERDEVIRDLIDDIDLVDASRRYAPRRPRRQSTRARWTWWQKREGKLHYSQPDYGARSGLQAISERRVPMADHKIGEEVTEGVSEEAPGIPAAITPRGAAG